MLQSLLKALNNFNSVTLPGFGGIMKMGSSYMFNEFLKFNDGKFSKFLQETESISEEEANIKIENFIKVIKNELSKTGSFSLNEVGTLNLIDGKIKLELLSFTAKKEEDKSTPKEKETKKIANSLSIDFPVKEAQQKIKALKDKQEIIFFTRGDNRKSIIAALNQKLKSLNNIDNTELDILEASQLKTEKHKDVKNTSIKEGSKKEVKEQVAKESDILKTVIEKEIEDNTIQEKEQAIGTTAKTFVQKDNKTPSTEKKNIENTETTEEEDLVALSAGAVRIEKEAKRRKRNKIIFWFALICVFSGGSIIGYLKQDVIAGWFKNSEQLSHNPSSNTIVGSELENNTKTEQIKEERIEPVVVVEKEQEEQEQIEQIIEEEIITETDEVLNDNKLPIDTEEEVRIEIAKQESYYVVVGSFSKEKNAKNLIKSLKEEGYDDALIYQNGNLKSVSLGIFSSASEAKKALKQSGRNGWVKKPN